MQAVVCIVEVRGQLVQSWFSPSTVWGLGLNSGCHPWWQAPLPAEPPLQSKIILLQQSVKKMYKTWNCFVEKKIFKKWLKCSGIFKASWNWWLGFFFSASALESAKCFLVFNSPKIEHSRSYEIFQSPRNSKAWLYRFLFVWFFNQILYIGVGSCQGFFFQMAIA